MLLFASTSVLLMTNTFQGCVGVRWVGVGGLGSAMVMRLINTRIVLQPSSVYDYDIPCLVGYYYFGERGNVCVCVCVRARAFVRAYVSLSVRQTTRLSLNIHIHNMQS